jgi:serine/threonine protein kinase
MSDDGILMEYIDGETLTQHLSNHPDYFKDRKNTDKFLRQLLDAVGYLHSHQVLHLDLKPDNILLTHINNEVKLIDLGCCYTDTFSDTQGRTNRYAAPEQLACESVDVRTDIYAIGKILELLPASSIYNKEIARCTAPDQSARYQSVDEILHDIDHQRQYYRYVALFVAIVAVLAVCIALLTHQQDTAPVVQESPTDTIASIQTDSMPKDTLQPVIQTPINKSDQRPQDKDEQTLFKEEMTQLIDNAYRSTIACFCDSLFPSPSPTTGRSWAEASTEFHNQTIQIADRLAKKYPNIPETSIRQESESRFQSLVSSVFNQMRNNGKN